MGELGEEMTDEQFMDWWKISPKYIGFEQWLEREEELRKGKTYTCPACNTINPESATICIKCGTVFEKPEEEEVPPGEGPQNWIPFFKACKEIGYDGYFAYEMCSPFLLKGHVKPTIEEIDRRYQKGFKFIESLQDKI